jgi:hypothetical protein
LKFGKPMIKCKIKGIFWLPYGARDLTERRNEKWIP